MKESGFKASRLVIFLSLVLLIMVYLTFYIREISQHEKQPVIKFNRLNCKENILLTWMTGWKNEQRKNKLIHDFATEYDFSNTRINLVTIDKENTSEAKQAQEIVRMIRQNIFEADIIPMNSRIYNEVSQLMNDSSWGKNHLVDFVNENEFTISQNAEVIKNPYAARYSHGIHTGPYIDGEYGVLWYNLNVASQLGIEVKNTGMSFDDLYGYARQMDSYNQKLTDKSKSKVLFCESRAMSLSILFENLVQTARQNNKLTGNQLFTENTEPLTDLLKSFEKLSDFAVLNESHQVISKKEAEKYFLKDHCLFMVGTTNLFSELLASDSARKVKIVPAELPFLEPGNGYYGKFEANYAVFKNSPNRNYAIQLLNYLSSEKFAEKWAKEVKNPTGIAFNMHENYLENDPYHNFLNYIAKKYNYNTWFSTGSEFLTENTTENSISLHNINNTLRGVLLKEITAEEAFNRFKINIIK